ncbi:MAG: methyltransferase domain-containing protein [Chloroflexi bacterium]|nr:methyltransferase domain-containing protein [Chloroflexota bacterium]MYF23426.1 methyltransferase domain-containing protein [Chloroflexota bacterium]
MSDAQRPDGWQPEQYARFRAEREQPFYDLLALVEPAPGGRVVDLGCGTGVLTRVLHERTQASQTVGIDRSEAMLRKSAEHEGGGIRFERGDIAEFSGLDGGRLDVVFANASIQWVPDHASLFPRLAAMLKPGGQLAMQMPANEDHASHAVAREVAQQSPHAEALGGFVYRHSIESAEWYAEQLARLGFAEQHVRIQVYLHRLPGPEDVVEWVKGSLLTGYRDRMSSDDYEAFETAYRQRLLAVLPDEHPFLYPFKRLLLWGSTS